MELSTPHNDPGARFYLSSSTGALESSHTRSRIGETSLATDLDSACGTPFICHWDSINQEAVVVYNRYERNEKHATGVSVTQSCNDSRNEFQLPILSRSIPTEDGLGAILRFSTRGDSIETPQSALPDYAPDYPVLAVTGARRSRRVRRRESPQVRKSDRELFVSRLKYHQMRFYNLCDLNEASPFIRCAHWHQDGRALAFASVFVETRSVGSRKAIVAVLWQTTTRPHRAVCVSLSLHRSPEGEQSHNHQGSHNQIVAHCSCCPLMSQTIETNGGCYHAEVCLEDNNFCNIVATEIRRREDIRDLQDKGDTIFGQCIPLDGTSYSPSKLTVLLDRNTSQNGTISSPWVFFMIFDPDSLLFVPVAKVKGKPFRCFLCRIPLSRRGVCGHEENAKKASKVLKRRRDGRSRLMLELAFPSDDTDDVSIEAQNALSESNGHSDDEENDPLNMAGFTNRSISIPEVYTPIDVRRPILPCRGEWNDMITITKALNSLRETDVLVLDDRCQGKCHKCGQLHSGQNHDGYARNVYLFTLFNGTHKIRVFDWWCHACEETRRFSGRGSGVFPATQNTAYTTELMYHWLEMTCFQGYSFRNAYRTTKAFQRTSSRQMRHKTRTRHGTGSNQDGAPNSIGDDTGQDQDVSRRRANDALREFIKLLDTNSTLMTEALYSCSTCEVPLTPSDCDELGISEEQGSRLKRYKAIVIDGTASGILTALPTLERDHVTVPPPKKSKSAIYRLQKLVKSNSHRKVLKQLMKIAKESFREWKKTTCVPPSNASPDSDSTLLRFWIKKEGANSCNGIMEPQKLLSETEVNVVHLILEDEPCFCSQNTASRTDWRSGMRISGSRQIHVRECIQLKKVFSKAKEDRAVLDLLRYLFSLHKSGQSQELPEAHPHPSQPEAEDVNHGIQGVNGDRNRSNSQVVQGTDNPVQRAELMDTQDSDSSDSNVEEEIQEIYNEVMNRRQLSGTWLTVSPSLANKHAQLFECTLLLVEYLLLEHVAMPYVGRFDGKQEEGTEGDDQNGMTSFSEKSMRIHIRVATALRLFSEPCGHDCNNNAAGQQVQRYCQCILSLREAALSVSTANPVLASFCQEVLKLQKPLQRDLEHLVKSLTSIMDIHLRTARKYFSLFERKCSEECKEYWKLWGTHNAGFDNNAQSDVQKSRTYESISDEGAEEDNGRGTKNDGKKLISAKEELEDSLNSGICFPGRKRCRPFVIYKATSEDFCNKNYTRSRSHSPGLMTVQCACDSPKLIGFIVMTQAESTSLALSSFLSHFQILPRTIYYDNACNLFLSVLIRVPWVLKYTRLEVDRFHYKSHTCSSYFDPDVYQEFDSHHTETAESINARIKKTIHQIRYLKEPSIIEMI